MIRFFAADFGSLEARRTAVFALTKAGAAGFAEAEAWDAAAAATADDEAIWLSISKDNSIASWCCRGKRLFLIDDPVRDSYPNFHGKFPNRNAILLRTGAILFIRRFGFKWNVEQNQILCLLKMEDSQTMWKQHWSSGGIVDV